MREKLIELLKDADDLPCGQTYDGFADYLLENGVIVLPCKVGDTVYRLAHNKDRSEYRIADLWEVVEIVVYEDEIGIIDDSDNYFTIEDIGKTVFLSSEAAEKALKGSAER